MPKSYIASEPAAARALRLDFSPYDQMRKRIESLELNGHHADKIEYIIKGGTWNAYPIKYQYWFMLESFRAANETGTRARKRKTVLTATSPLPDLQKALEKEQTKNETAKHRLIGVTLETRPDAISPKTITYMRAQGCTRVELGLQAPDNEILELIRRGHTVEEFHRALKLLRDAGFKVDLHFMPDLPGTTADHDVEMYKLLFSDPGLKPDMVKIYPNTVIPSAELYQWFLDGRYKPYGDKALFEALLQMKESTPRYCRISRLIRDIPATEIKGGNAITNLREMLEAEMKKRGTECHCLRCREIGRVCIKHPKEAERLTTERPQFFVESYETIGGTEYFLTFEDSERKAVYAFLRLRIPEKDLDNKKMLYTLIPEIKDVAFVRELHTYGNLVKIGAETDGASQHKGYGKALLAEAEKISKEHGFKKVAVISGVGVRGYYRKWGYKKQGTYMVKSI
jgi:elongator complex protein 3